MTNYEKYLDEEPLTYELTDEQAGQLNEAIGLKELEEISERFKSGTPTEDDLLNYIQRYSLTLDNGAETRAKRTTTWKHQT